VALDPDMAALLAIVAANPPPPFDTTPPDEQRALSRARLPRIEPTPVRRVAQLTVPTAAGDMAARLYVPGPDAEYPLVLFCHGGGWVLCDLDTHDEYCRRLARMSGCAVLAVDYRRAPEAPYPAAFDDCLAALRWVAVDADALGIDADRIAVAGDSAGGNLAAAIAIAARNAGGPAIRHQLLIYPALDIAGDTASWREDGVGLLTPAAMRWFWSQYRGVGRADDPLLCPSRVADASRLPPATVITAEYDPLRDEGEAYARRLAAAGGDVLLQRFDGMSHGFASCFGLVAKADEAMALVAGRLHAVMQIDREDRLWN
jgi:acetyl esterase